MNEPDATAEDSVVSSQDGDSVVTRVVNIINRRGLHARAAARFVKLAATFDAGRVPKNLARSARPLALYASRSVT